MPELPEVETVKEVLNTQILGKKIENIVVRYNGIIKQDVDLFIKELLLPKCAQFVNTLKVILNQKKKIIKRRIAS